MANLQPLINGIAYDWSQITVNILGSDIAGISEISYNEEQEITDNYGAGNFPVSRGFGKVKYTGKIKMFMEEVEAITSAAPNGRLQEIPEFDITIAYLNPANTIVTHRLKNCRFKHNMRQPKSGDVNVDVDIDLAVGQILWK